MAHTFKNLSFELSEAIPGGAFAWEQAIVSSLIEIANFGFVAASAYETWGEGWGTDGFIFEFDQLVLAQGLFPSGDPEPLQAEGFEWAWANNTWSGVLGLTDDGEFAGPLPADSFESGWLNDSWSGTLGATADGAFDGGSVAHESFDFGYVQNSSGYWPALSEVQEIVQGSDGASPSTLPVGVEYLDSPRRIKLPAAYLAGDGRGFLDVGFKAGDHFWSQGSDLVGSSDLFIVQGTPTNAIVTVQGTTWANPGINTTPTRLMELYPALFVTGNVPAAGVLDEHEYFDASSFEEMDTQ